MAYSGNLPYNPLVLKNEIEDQFNSHVDLTRFVTVDNTLVGVTGDTITIHKYTATNGTEDVTEGNGNTKEIEVTYTSVPYTIKCAQNRFQWSDEQAMKDPIMVLTGHRHMGTDMFNHEMGDVYAEYGKAPMVVLAPAYDFGAFVDAASMLNSENIEGEEIFAFVNAKDVAGLRKALGASLQYVTAHAIKGYIGEAGGVTIVQKKDAVDGEIRLGTKEAVTLFNKKGTELETERDVNNRLTTDYSRKYYVAALTNEEKAIRILKGKTATLTEDADIDEEKTYFTVAGAGYIAVANPVKADLGKYYEIA